MEIESLKSWVKNSQFFSPSITMASKIHTLQNVIVTINSTPKKCTRKHVAIMLAFQTCAHRIKIIWILLN